MNKDILKKYVCTNPFRYIDMQVNGDYVCCPSWCTTDIRVEDEDSWESAAAIDIRKSVLDGSYRHCEHTICPTLSELLNNGKVSGNFLPIDDFKNLYNITSIEDVKNIKNTPEEILFGFDRSCNFKCPSCRADLVPNDNEDLEEHKRKLKILKYIETNFAKGAKKLLITGSGDPFYSKIYRDYLQNFDETKYPNLEEIQIITNGKMLNKKMWDSLSAKKYIKTIEISIDAGTKFTYENVTRLNGNWDVLIENLKFISTIQTLNNMVVSMVVSEKNYLEMEIFYNKMMDIFKNSKFFLQINFRQHVYWGTGLYSEADVEKMQIFNPEHTFFPSFMVELLKIHNKPCVSHNFNHLIERKNIL
jgi:hypothetical protein